MNKPKVRFKGYTGEWVEKKLGEINVLNKEKYNPNQDVNNYKCIEMEHIKPETGRLIDYTDSINQKSIKNKFDNNSILFGKLRPYLKKYYLPNFNGVCSTEFLVMKPLFNKNFSYYMLQSSKFNLLILNTTGTKMPRLNWSDIKDETFKLPCLEEQQKIGNLFKSLDQEIELMEENIKLKKLNKKGLMQKIFNQEIRFNGYTGEWVEYSLDSLGVFKTGSKLSKKDLDINGKNKVILYGELFTKYNTSIKKIISRTNETCKSISVGNEILIPMSTTTGAKEISIALSIEEEGIYLGGDINIYCSEYVYNHFLAYYLTFNWKKMAVLSTGITIFHLTGNELKNINIRLSSLEEQQKIGNLFKSIDEEIELLDEQLRLKKLNKKYYMQTMFC